MKSRSMRLVQSAALAATLAASVFTVVGGNASVASAASKKYTVAFVVGAEADPFFQSMFVGASAEAAKDNINLIWQGNPVDYSPSTQIPVVQQVLALKPNALVIGPTDTKALQPYIAQAVKSGIPVFNVDSGDANQSNITSWVTGNNVQGGQAAADALASAMGYDANCTASAPCTVAVGVSSITTSTDAARLAGFTAELKAKYPHISALNPIVSNSQPSVAQSGFANDIAAHALKGIFAIDGTDAEGAASAITAAGSAGANIKVIAYDAYAANIASMQAGKIAAIISQQPTLEGTDIIAAVYKDLTSDKGKTGPQKNIAHLLTLPNYTLTPTSSAAIIAKYQYSAS